MCLVARLLEVFWQESEGGVETVRLEPLYGSSLHAKSPGVEAGHQGSSAGRTLGSHVGLLQSHSSLGQPLGYSHWSVGSCYGIIYVAYRHRIYLLYSNLCLKGTECP